MGHLVVWHTLWAAIAVAAAELETPLWRYLVTSDKARLNTHTVTLNCPTNTILSPAFFGIPENNEVTARFYPTFLHSCTELPPVATYI